MKKDMKNLTVPSHFCFNDATISLCPSLRSRANHPSRQQREVCLREELFARRERQRCALDRDQRQCTALDAQCKNQRHLLPHQRLHRLLPGWTHLRNVGGNVGQTKKTTPTAKALGSSSPWKVRQTNTTSIKAQHASMPLPPRKRHGRQQPDHRQHGLLDQHRPGPHHMDGRGGRAYGEGIHKGQARRHDGKMEGSRLQESKHGLRHRQRRMVGRCRDVRGRARCPRDNRRPTICHHVREPLHELHRPQQGYMVSARRQRLQRVQRRHRMDVHRLRPCLPAHRTDEIQDNSQDELRRHVQTRRLLRQRPPAMEAQLNEQGTNSCINGPAAVCACYLAIAQADDSYYEKAKKTYLAERATLFEMSNGKPTGKVWDSYDQGNKSYNYWASTYNQGTCLGAAIMLYNHYGEQMFKDDADAIIKWSEAHMANSKGIIHVCQTVSGDLTASRASCSATFASTPRNSTLRSTTPG